MAKPKPKDDTPTPTMDEVLPRMLATPPTPHIKAAIKKPKQAKRP